MTTHEGFYLVINNVWLNWLGEFVEVYHDVLLLPKNCLVFWKRQPWVSLADVTLLVGVHKYLLNFWFKRVEDCYIRVSQKWGPSHFCLKRAERNLLFKSLPLGYVLDLKYIRFVHLCRGATIQGFLSFSTWTIIQGGCPLNQLYGPIMWYGHCLWRLGVVQEMVLQKMKKMKKMITPSENGQLGGVTENVFHSEIENERKHVYRNKWMKIGVNKINSTALMHNGPLLRTNN